MKKFLAFPLLCLLLSPSAFAVRALPLYDLTASTPRPYNPLGDTSRLPCKSNYHGDCWKGVLNVAEPDDLAALEEKLTLNLKAALEGTRTDFVVAQGASNKALLESDELKESIRKLIREEFKKMQEEAANH